MISTMITQRMQIAIIRTRTLDVSLLGRESICFRSFSVALTAGFSSRDVSDKPLFQRRPRDQDCDVTKMPM